MPSTFKKIQTITVGSGGVASIEFTNIPQTFTDLKVVVSARTTTAATRGSLLLELNGSTSDFTARALYGEDGNRGSEIPSPTRRLGVVPAANATVSAFGNAEIYIPNYTSANFKSISTDIVFEQNSSSVYDLYMTGTLWSNNAAITSLSIKPASDNWAQYSSVTLYGVSNVNLGTITSSPYATGGTVTSNGQYYIHTFTSDGTFTPSQTLSCEYLSVGGGGGGGCAQAGGGGAGELDTATGLSLTAQAYSITVGAGGAGSSSTANKGNNGGTTSFSTVTSLGGGGGASRSNTGGANGGSGGGGVYVGAAGTASGSNTNAGGLGAGASGNDRGGGGGGATAVGAAAATNAGAGGAGFASLITGITLFYASGGGGGAENSGRSVALGGSSIGGNGGVATITPATNAMANRGSGGGGDGNTGTGGNGSSGIVIIRYTV